VPYSAPLCKPNKLYGTKWKDKWELWIENDMKASDHHVYLCTILALASRICYTTLNYTTLWTSAHVFPHTMIHLLLENYFKNERLSAANRILITCMSFHSQSQLLLKKEDNLLTTIHYSLRGPWPAGCDWLSSTVGPGSSPRTSCRPLQPFGRTKFWARRTLNGAYTLCT
jgi:hypothetical protein